ncbi:zinc ABC transporter substrate-binding protein [Rhizobium ruizarguesonis]|uniref:High-affinity zinc uptake system protein ZnuA n=1 Tax=Rhizobium ruizarguesonis TaxID=2081791 RepID=A0AAE8QF65_9HYPH|nr:zinc ABC transporter substrate-binding protein [Rhizobium ruizarguesonis]TCA33352.1 zinc ABC transporter substrate-binding protein [Rhizobium leguminosarum bv. viciae]NEI48186.1 zinc ABC transporter substrate-binding protein [Rhizobium ruizarguesonis]NEJ12956.1 zinc ABC transporter substrate-binding protein [Rhizobium ruizarguesonis]NEK26939.1 zinc ABC transporter substrate-binding protein [Rhizobium ruizarguesonis]TAU00545.1 zinc ABC transporter substrate-binding protein [Rhizobium ruizarg
MKRAKGPALKILALRMPALAIPVLAIPALLFAGTMRAADAPVVVTSIKPIHSLVSAIMQGVGEPELIVDGAASPHTYNLKPSNARALQNAKVIFWVGPGLEAFLEKPLQALGRNASIAELDNAPGLVKLPFREGGAFEPHDDAPEHESASGQHDEAEAAEAAHDADPGHDSDHDHDHGTFDTHLWLDPMNAKAMAAMITTTLVAADPANALTYQGNAKALDDRLDALDTELKGIVAPVKGKPFIVFHDAYQYFEHRYGIRVAGSITVSPETIPGAERVSEIHRKVGELGATCVFAEPQFEPRLVNVVIEGTSAKSGVLDPEAATLKAGPDLYFTLMRGIANSMKDCLSSA